jgi:nitrate reductase NapE component
MGRMCNYDSQVIFGFFHLLSQLEILGYAFFVWDLNSFQILFGQR